MELQLDTAYIAGISVRTSNEPGRAPKDIPALWQRLLSEHIKEKIPGRAGDEIYCLYTDYESDHTGVYTALLGYAVPGPDMAPAGLTCKKIAAGTYKKYEVIGALWNGAVFCMWMQIWNAGLPRTFTCDFEVYGPLSQDPVNGKMEIFIALNHDNTPG